MQWRPNVEPLMERYRGYYQYKLDLEDRTHLRHKWAGLWPSARPGWLDDQTPLVHTILFRRSWTGQRWMHRLRLDWPLLHLENDRQGQPCPWPTCHGSDRSTGPHHGYSISPTKPSGDEWGLIGQPHLHPEVHSLDRWYRWRIWKRWRTLVTRARQLHNGNLCDLVWVAIHLGTANLHCQNH